MKGLFNPHFISQILLTYILKNCISATKIKKNAYQVNTHLNDKKVLKYVRHKIISLLNFNFIHKSAIYSLLNACITFIQHHFYNY